MTIEIKQGNRARYFEVFEGEEKIGEIIHYPPEQEGDEEFWNATLWSLMGTGKTWGATGDSYEEIVGYTHELYKEFVAERRELKRPVPGVRVVSTPMGGQRRK
ncbi:MAG TPA: hypothetical protein VFY14_22785 [Streptomyces sp.]|nr:hypothetical protein [Streptomyces sp.]